MVPCSLFTPFSCSVVAIQEEISSLDERFVFGAGLDLDLLGIEVDDNTLIPGLAVASSRAKPLAGRFTISFNISSFTKFVSIMGFFLKTKF